MSEDCLFLDIYAPTNATSLSRLPVFVYFTGGGFGQIATPNTNGTALVYAAEMDLIVVVFNYRVGPYGFLTTGDPTRDDIDSNSGLQDQLMVLRWAQEHIHRFGGNPSHVVLGGASAGAASIALLLAACDEKDEGLFIGAAAESVSFGPVLTASQSRYQYVKLATNLGCWSDDDATVLTCMRLLSTEEIQAKNTVYPYPNGTSTERPRYMWSPFIDGDLVRDLTVRRYNEGHFVRVPIILGDNTNGGTNFAPGTAASLEESNQFMRNQFPTISDEQLARLDKLYPNANETCPNVGCWWRQTSDVYGETRYMCPSLYLSDVLSQGSKTYTYRWDVEDPDATAAGYGVQHVIEAYPLFGPENFFLGGSPPSYLSGGINEITGPLIRAYWTSFIRTLDPNRYRYPGSAEWEDWGRKERGRRRLRFGTGGTTEMETINKGLKERCEYLDSIAISLAQ